MKILHTTPAQDGFYMPAEFAPHEGCLMIWPERADSWQYGAYAARKAFLRVIETISESESMTVLCSEGQYDNARAQLPDRVRLVVMETDDAWARDVGPTFVINGRGERRGIDWGFFGSPLRDVRLMGGVAYVDPVLSKTMGGTNQGKQATGVPKLQAKLGVEWDTPAIPGVTLTANATAASKQPLTPRTHSWVSASAPSSGYMAIPTQAPTYTGLPSSIKGCESVSTIDCATKSIGGMSRPGWTMILNSSALIRAMASICGKVMRSRLAASTSTWSPTPCPRVSLIAVKLSRSTNSNAKPVRSSSADCKA